MSDGGPIFYHQARIGRREALPLPEVRSMIVNAERALVDIWHIPNRRRMEAKRRAL
ncbi:hypothetical protein CCP2SC5_1160004 [Azospirillaceae bacterium]